MPRKSSRPIFIVLLIGGLVFPLVASPARAAQLDSVEMLAQDPVATAKWYAANFGGKRAGAAVKFGDVTLSWKKVPEGGQTSNPAIAHIGFSVENIDNKLATLRKNKAVIVKDVHSGPASRWAIASDPDGKAVGIIEFAGGKPGLNHVMLNAPLRERRGTLSWYQKVVGGEISNFGGSPLWTGIQTNNVWIMFSDDMPGSDQKNDFTTASMTWRVDDVTEAKAIQASRAESDENIGEGLVVVDPCGLPMRFIEDANAVSAIPPVDKLATTAEITVTEAQYEQIRAKEGDFVLEVIRVLGQDDCTLGQMFVNGIALVYVLELPWQGNKPTISSIPPGTYKLDLHYDTKKRMRIHLMDVPGRSGIQMHIGTTPEDTQGCVLIGTGVSAVGCTLTNTREAAARLRRAYYGTEDSENVKLDTDRPAVMIISDSITTAGEAEDAAQE